VALVKQLRGELKTMLSGNKEQKAENERLRAREATIEQRVRNALEGEQNRLRQERAGSHHIDRTLLDARQGLRRPLTEAEIHSLPAVNATYTRTAANEIHRQFHRLPNPDMTLYVFAHLAGSDPVPVPGYTTVFPLYRRVQYALPGERVEDY
jgi:conjugative transfer region lipoprotein (TIGR03751 family)